MCVPGDLTPQQPNKSLPNAGEYFGRQIPVESHLSPTKPERIQPMYRQHRASFLEGGQCAFGQPQKDGHPLRSGGMFIKIWRYTSHHVDSRLAMPVIGCGDKPFGCVLQLPGFPGKQVHPHFSAVVARPKTRATVLDEGRSHDGPLRTNDQAQQQPHAGCGPSDQRLTGSAV
jgi:hypothetical protein